jgi:hypothetical protein
VGFDLWACRCDRRASNQKWKVAAALQHQKVRKWPVRLDIFQGGPLISYLREPCNRAAITSDRELLRSQKVVLHGLYILQAAASKMIVSYTHTLVKGKNI